MLGREKVACSKSTLSLKEPRRSEALTSNKVSFAVGREFFAYLNVLLLKEMDETYWVVIGLDTLLLVS